MDELSKINTLYQKIGLDSNGQPYDRPPKRYPVESVGNYGYSGNSSIPPRYVNAEEKRV